MSLSRSRALVLLVLTLGLALPACGNGSSSGATGTAGAVPGVELTGPPFEVVLLDDQPDPFATVDASAPKGISQFQEAVVFSPEDIQGRSYVRLVVQPGEAFPQAMARAKPWFDARALPKGDRLLFSLIIEENEITKVREPVGARTYVGTSTVVLTKDDVASATIGAVPDQDNKPQTVAMVELNPLASERFAKFTRENVFRRIAVMTRGNVLMAPMIRSEITGGKLTISGDQDLPQDQQRAELQRFVDGLQKPAAPAPPK